METIDRSVARVKRVVKALTKSDALGGLLRTIDKRGRAYAFGGMPRDVMFGGAKYFGDIDIFVAGVISESDLTSVAHMVGRTNFGGFRLFTGRYDVDIWELHRSLALRSMNPSMVTIDALLRTVCFSTDAVAVAFEDGKIVASPKFWHSLRYREISFVVPPLPGNVLQATRAARLIIKHSLRPANDVASYLADVISEFGTDALVSAEVRWKGRRLLDAISLELLNRLLSDARANVGDAETHLQSIGHQSG